MVCPVRLTPGFVFSHYPTQNRFALLLEMLCFLALSDAKPLRTFAGNALFYRIIQRKTASHFCWKCFKFPTEPDQSAGIAASFGPD